MNTAGDLNDRLLRSEGRVRLLFEHAPVPYDEIDCEGRISRVNRARCAMLGYTPGEQAGKYVWEFVAPEEREQCRESTIRRLARAEELAPVQRRLVRKNGGSVSVETYQDLIEDEAGKIAGIRSILINITDRE